MKSNCSKMLQMWKDWWAISPALNLKSCQVHNCKILSLQLWSRSLIYLFRRQGDRFPIYMERKCRCLPGVGQFSGRLRRSPVYAVSGSRSGTPIRHLVISWAVIGQGCGFGVQIWGSIYQNFFHSNQKSDSFLEQVIVNTLWEIIDKIKLPKDATNLEE